MPPLAVGPFAATSWQPLVAYLLIAVASAWVLRQTWRTYKKAARGSGRPGEPAGGCAGCAHNSRGAERAKPKPLVQLDSKRRNGGSA